MTPWTPLLEVTPTSVRLLVLSAEGDELVKAQLPHRADHPRALLVMLEGLALYSGKALCVAISADVSIEPSLGLGSFPDLGESWPAASALVSFHFVPPPPGRRLAGVGDFRRLRRLGRVR